MVNTAAGETGPGVTLGVITATPVIDVARRWMYVIGYLKDKFSNLFFRLHAIALKDGKDVVKPAVLDQNTIPQVPGTGEPPTPNNTGKIYFDPAQHFNRAAAWSGLELMAEGDAVIRGELERLRLINPTPSNQVQTPTMGTGSCRP